MKLVKLQPKSVYHSTGSISWECSSSSVLEISRKETGELLNSREWWGLGQGKLFACLFVRVGLKRKLSAEELMLLNCGVGEDS